jgi:hypothetical protein
MSHIYYLHQNGNLIAKRHLEGIEADLRESDFVIAFWPCNPRDRMTAWTLLVEALAAGANKDRVFELADKWGCSDTDAAEFVHRLGGKLTRDGDAWCATRGDFVDLQESPSGFGDTALEALAALCRNLGYKPAKMCWGNHFADLMK